MSLCGTSSRGKPFGRGKPIQRKVVVCGDGACGTPFPRASRASHIEPYDSTLSLPGKTSLLNVFTRGFFSQVYEPTVFENYVHDIYVDDQQVELSLWDTAGQEEFDRLRSLSYAETHVIMICFSVRGTLALCLFPDRDVQVDNPVSLENVETKWLDEILEYCPGVKLVLVALKCDLRDDRPVKERLQRYGAHPVQYEEGLAVARRIRASRYLECSSKHNRGVAEVFYEAARVSLSTRPKGSGDGCVIM
ncbi:P-loop containing nucleoside triphosphate hydrolase protein [Mycena crocata]|nr:P-loop containing nucleoside triphosphate hydrolase protein [Mycena crocata]